MSDPEASLAGVWVEAVGRLAAELASLPAAERAWIEQRLSTIARLQVEIDQLFEDIGGSTACADCRGGCCGCGRHHLTLTNLLACLCAGEEPPAPNPGATCPWLGVQGCRLAVTRRPFNCITFFCETLDARLNPASRERLAHLERRLRSAYEAVAGRYPVASLRGLWIALERYGTRPLLQGRSAAC